MIRSALALALVVSLPTWGHGLERAARMPESPPDDWAAGSTCSIFYFNYCNGWIWVWGEFERPGSQVGVVFDACAASCELTETSFYVVYGLPAGYGFTGALLVSEVDENDCPTGAPLASQVYLPRSGWDLHHWSSVTVGDRFAVIAQHTNLWDKIGSAEYGLDHPAAGPTGPQGCGTCYPSPRVNHTFYWGTVASPLCPGSPYDDGVCTAELLWIARLSCATSVEPRSWGGVKALYH